MRRGLVMTALLAATTLPTAPAWAEAIARASANSGSFSDFANSASNPALVNEPFVSARARASDLSSHALSASGALNPCFQVGSPGLGCAIVGTDVLVDAYAVANGNNGSLRAGARSIDGGRGAARATLQDSITLSSPLIDIHLHLNAPSGAPQASTAGSRGSSEITFRMFVDVPNPGPDDPPIIPFFEISTYRDDSDSFFSTGIGPGENAIELDSGTSIPGSFHYTIDLTDPVFAGLFTPFVIAPGFPPLPPLFDLNDPIPFGFELSAEAACFSASDCFAQARADDTLYVALTGLSANGYSYPGLQVVEPPPGAIPEPASALLLLAGLASVAAGAQRRR